MNSPVWQVFDNILSADAKEPDIFVEGKETELRLYLGGGGSKEVYDVDIDGDRYALGILKFSDPEGGFESDYWQAPSEPEFVDEARDSDIPTYEIYQRVNLDVEGISHPAFLMTRDQDQENPVYESKNNVQKHDFLNEVNNRNELLKILEPLAADIARMTENEIPAGLDSFNISEIDGLPTVFYTDPPTSEIQDVDKSTLLSYYTDYALAAMVNTAQNQAFENEAVEKMTGRNSFRDSVEEAIATEAAEQI